MTKTSPTGSNASTASTTQATALPDLTGTKFQAHEFECKCGCGLGYADMQPSTITKLLKARKIAGVAFTIKSAIRCKAHNAKSGGRPNSAHLRGFAVDISAPTSQVAYKILTALLASGFTRLGYNAKLNFFHVDDDPSLPQNLFFDY